MKLSTLLLVLFLVSASANTFSQKFTFEIKGEAVKDVLAKIEANSNYKFLYRSDLIDVSREVNLNIIDESIESILAKIFDPAKVTYKIFDNDLVVIANSALQQLKVTGRVTDAATGEPLVGVNVIIEGTQIGILTDAYGKYSLAQPERGSTIAFSFIGYLKQYVVYSGQLVIDVKLSPDVQTLEDVVVVGYGTARRESLTGSVSNITAKNIQTTVSSSLAQQLQGKISGLQIRQYTGEPGNFNSMINVRGFGTPLFIIDGISGYGGAAFQKLNPDDIESISILKDASAAIYGFNAANGVIIVTTKKGKTGRTEFKYSAVTGFQSPTNIPEMANAGHYLEMRNDANVTIGGSPYILEDELAKWQQGLPGYESTDWYNETFKNVAMQTQHNLSARGGNERLNYFVSFGYFRDDGLLKSNDLNYKQYSFRNNLTANLTKNLVADINISGRYDMKERPGWDFENILKGTRVSLPTYSVYANDNPEYYSLVAPTNLNAVAFADRDYTGYGETKNLALESSVSLTYDVPFIKGLKLKGLASYINTNTGDKTLSKSYNLYSYDDILDIYTPVELYSPSRISNGITDAYRLTFQGYLIYNTKIAENHNIDVTLVYEQRKTKSRYSYLEREYDFYTNDQINQASVNNQITDGYESETAFISYLGRLNYNFKSKYLLEFAARYDGSYRYSPEKRWGFFPVISGGWRISEEQFIKDRLPFLSNLKIRGSYGLIGLDVGNPFQYVQGFSTSGGGGYEFVDGVYYSGVASPLIVNEKLTWATAKTEDIGLDLGLFRGKLEVEFDVYQRDRKGLLAYRSVSLPNTFGGTLPQENLNSDRTRGIEFSLALNNSLNDFHYSVKLNFNYARTMSVHVESAPPTSSYDRWRNYSSDRWSDIGWGYVVIGQFQNSEEIINSPGQSGTSGNIKELPGDYKYQDVNNDGVINANDMMPIFWTGDPKLFYGLILNADWKGFDFSALFQGSGKNSSRYWGGGVYGQMFCFGGNLPEYFYDRWHQSDPYDPTSDWISGEWPATRMKDDVGAMYNESAIWRKDASYLRFKSVEIGYSFSPPFIKKLGINDIRIFANAHNLFTICDPWVKIFDPEKQEGTSGNTGLSYPLTKSYNLGINISF